MKGDIKLAPLYSVWQIDAWQEGWDDWEWNDKLRLFEFRSRSLDMKRVFPATLRRFLARHKGPYCIDGCCDLGKGWYYVNDEWDYFEICRKTDGCPFYACIRETPSY